MITRLVLSLIIISMCSFCINSKPSPKTISKNPQLMENKSEKTIIRAIRYQNGNAKGVVFDQKQAENLISIALKLLETAEPMRVHLEEEEMKSLKNTASGFKIFFSPALETTPNTARLSKMLFLLEGNFSNQPKSPNALFFVALDDDNQYIQSPYAAQNMAELVKSLDNMLK